MKYRTDGAMYSIEVPLEQTPILHRWKNVSEKSVAFLGNWHRHVIHARFGVEFSSTHPEKLPTDNRVIEFFVLQRVMNSVFKSVLSSFTVATVAAGGKAALTESGMYHVEESCERIARTMVEYFLEGDQTKELRESIPPWTSFQVWCEVSEDNECRSRYLKQGLFIE